MWFEGTDASLDAIMECAATTNLPGVTTRLILYKEQPCADLEITLHDKPFDPGPRPAGCAFRSTSTPRSFAWAGWVPSLTPPATSSPAPTANLFGINTGVSVTDDIGRGVGFCPVDYPLVSLDTPGCWRYSLDFVPKKPIAYVNLFNNQWSTNFRLWNRGTWTSRVRLWAISHYGAEPSLITPSLEARYPLLAAAADGAPGPLPSTRRGLELSRKGILVTAFGANPDGSGTLLRLWEYAGQSGAVRVRLPDGTDIKQARTVTCAAVRRQASDGQEGRLQGPGQRIRPGERCLHRHKVTEAFRVTRREGLVTLSVIHARTTQTSLHSKTGEAFSVSDAEQLLGFGTDVRVLHERLTYEHSSGAALCQSLDIGAGADAAFGDQERGQMICRGSRVA